MTAIHVCGMVRVRVCDRVFVCYRVCVRDHGWNRDCNTFSTVWFSS